MAVTGVVLIGFVVGHLVGNLQVFEDPDRINGYSHFLQSLGPTLWAARIFLLACVTLHIWAATVLALESRRARGDEPYAVKKWIQATVASRYMRWTGYVVLAFILYHLAQFTLGVAQPATFKANIPHYTMKGDYHVLGFTVVPAGTEVLDVRSMVIRGFSNPRRRAVLHRRGRPPLAPPAARRRQPLPDARLAQPPLGAGAARSWSRLLRGLLPRQPGDPRRRSSPASSSRPETMAQLDSKIPPGPLADKWRRHKADIKLVNPANKRKYEVIVVGAGPRGRLGRRDPRRARLQGELLRLPRQPEARALDRGAGRHQRRQELPERRRQRPPALLRHDQGRRLPLARGERPPPGRGLGRHHRPVRGAGRALRARVRRPPRQPLLRRRAGLPHVLRARPDRPAAPPRRLLGAFAAGRRGRRRAAHRTARCSTWSSWAATPRASSCATW